MKMEINCFSILNSFLRKYQYFIAVVLLAILQSGCQSGQTPKRAVTHDQNSSYSGNVAVSQPEAPESKPAEGHPRIHSIGDSSPVLVFASNGDLEIPIRGQDLSTDAWDIAADVQPAASLKPGVDYYLDTTNPEATSSLIFLHFSNHAITNFATCDRLTVNINVSRKPLDYGLVQNAYDMADLSKSVLFPKFTENDKTNISSGNISPNLARIIGYKARAANWSSNQIDVMSNWLASVTQRQIDSEIQAIATSNNVPIVTILEVTNSLYKLKGKLQSNSQKQSSPKEGAMPANISPNVITAVSNAVNKAGPNINDSFSQGYADADAFISRPPNIFTNVPLSPLVASLSRTFILYSEQDYRNEILNGLVNIQNITAYPLSFPECKKMFGSFVARNFYALRLTIHNPTTNDQVISIGAITAYGRALVATNPTNSGPIFTIPIQMSPESEQQMYTMVSSVKGALNDSDSVRDWVFGTLSFAGALAAAYGTGFGASEDYVKAVALATGTAIPGLGALWADQRPFHLMNINNFAMPDVVKIPKGGGSLDGEYLFFSKGKLQGVLQDPFLKGITEDCWESATKKQKAEKFSAQPVSLAWDSLEIPFEITYQAATNANPNNQNQIPNISNPTNQTVVTNGPTAFNVKPISGLLPFQYQWYSVTNLELAATNSNPALALPNETNAALNVSNVSTKDQGSYWVIASNAFGSITSSIAHLTVTNNK